MERLLSKSDYFAHISLWPFRSKLDPNAWLSNFSESELPFAIRLLDNFIYYSEELTSALFKSAFHNLSNHLNEPRHEDRTEIWDTFRSKVIVSYIEGESPNVTDSGMLFCRLAREELGISQHQIVSPERAIRMLISDDRRPVVFVDDFVGSGDQAKFTWHRKYALSLDAGASISFDEYCASNLTAFVAYIPLIAAATGAKSVRENCRGMHLLPAHELEASASATHLHSAIWEGLDYESSIEFLQVTSFRAGYGAEEWRGHSELALNVAFAHSIPDATLPLLYSDRAGWKPLMRRST